MESATADPADIPKIWKWGCGINEQWKVRQKWLAMALGECSCKNIIGNIPELLNTTLMVVLYWVLHDTHTLPEQLQILYPDVQHWEKVIDSIEATGGWIEWYSVNFVFKWTLEHEQLDKEHCGVPIHRELKHDFIHNQVLHICCLVNGFKLKLHHDVKICLIQMGAAIEKENTKHVIGPPMIISAGPAQARYTQLLTIIHNATNSSRYLLQDRVSVETEPLPN